MKYIRLFESITFGLTRENFTGNREKYISFFIERFNKYPTKFMNIYWIPTIKQAPELEDTIKMVYEKLLKNPISYLNYFSYLEDGFINRENMKFELQVPIQLFWIRHAMKTSQQKFDQIVASQLLSEDIIGWLIEDETEYKKLLDKIVIAAEKNIDKWMRADEFWKLPTPVKEKMNYITRGKQFLWDLKT